MVLQLTGGNGYLNTVVPYTNPLYKDYRPAMGIPDDQVIPLDDAVGLHPRMGPMKSMYDRGDVAVIHGVGYPNSPRSHFRSLDIWHTCEPDTLGTEGWLGRAARDIDSIIEDRMGIDARPIVEGQLRKAALHRVADKIGCARRNPGPLSLVAWSCNWRRPCPEAVRMPGHPSLISHHGLQ